MTVISVARFAENLATSLRRFSLRRTVESFAIKNPSVLERKPERREQRPRLVVGLRRGGDADVQPPERVDLVVVDLREDDLFLHAERVVAAAVERAVRDAAEVADPGHRDRHQAVEELVHPLAAQRHHAADRVADAHLEVRDRLLRLGDDRLLSGDLGQVPDRVVEDLAVLGGLANADVDRDLLDPRHFHATLVPELRREFGHHRILVMLVQARHGFPVPSAAYCASTISPFDLNTRTRRPSGMVFTPTRSAFLVCGLKSAMLETSIGISLSMMPPWMPFIGFGRWCFFTRLMPSTTTCPASMRRSTVPRLPLSRPAITITSSPLRIFSIYSTSGASDTIFMNRSERSSRVTGPKIRVPIGSSFGLSSTAAFESKRTSEPSGRRTPCAV